MSLDPSTVEGFGREWHLYDQEDRTESDLRQTFDRYFSEFPWDELPDDAVGIDVGCGSGRWAQFVAPRVGLLLCVDPSSSIEVARRRLDGRGHIALVQTAAGALAVADGTLDFAYSLGVLHHTPDPAAALRDCVRVLKPGAPMLVYLYYAFDDKPRWFRMLWQLSDRLRRVVSRQRFSRRRRIADALALLVYLPSARAASLVARLGGPADKIPLNLYRDKPFYVMRTDALDRFGTRLEHRFTRAEVTAMMEGAGLVDVEIATGPPYWCAFGHRA